MATAAAAALSGGALAAPFACPKTGGELVVGVSASVPGLDPQSTAAISNRTVGLNIYESLVTRGENYGVVNELAQSVGESDDGLTYTFRLRPGVLFHNGQALTSADVAASFERYARVGQDKTRLAFVAGWETPDADTFVVRMKQRQPMFLSQLSSYIAPLAILPVDQKDKAPQDLDIIGTGPFRLAEFVPDSHVLLERFEGYVPNASSEGLDGFAGYKVACVDRARFRIVPETGARVAGVETGELDIAESVPTTALARLEANPDVDVQELKSWWVHWAMPNIKMSPTDKLAFRQAVLVGLDMEEIMEIATDGAYSLDKGMMVPGTEYYTEAAAEWFNPHDVDRAKALLAEAGYNGETVVLATNNQYASMNKAAQVMAEQLRDLGVNVRVDVTDWPTALAKRNGDSYHYLFGGKGGGEQGPDVAMTTFTFSRNFQNLPAADDRLEALFEELTTTPDLERRKAVTAELETHILENGYALPFGHLSELQAVRHDVENFAIFRVVRLSNVWLDR